MAEQTKSLPKWVVQLLAWGTGVGGIIADYGLGLMGANNVPFVYYALCIGIGFGINPGFLIKALLDGYAATQNRPREIKHDEDKE